MSSFDDVRVVSSVFKRSPTTSTDERDNSPDVFYKPVWGFIIIFLVLLAMSCIFLAILWVASNSNDSHLSGSDRFSGRVGNHSDGNLTGSGGNGLI
jgi:hypothetical protein